MKYENEKSRNEKSIAEKTIKNLKRMLESESKSRGSAGKVVADVETQVEGIKLQVKGLK